MGDLLCLDIVDRHLAVAAVEGGLDGVAQALGLGGGDAQAVHDELDGVELVAVELHAVFNLADFAVHAQVALLAQVLEELLVVALAVAHQGGEDADLAVGIALRHELHDFLTRVFDHGLAREIGRGAADAGIEQAQEVVDFGYGADCGTGILSVVVPIVERGLRLMVFCSMAMTGLRPLTMSTSGRSRLPSRLRA